MKLSKKALITALLLVGCFATVFAQVLPPTPPTPPTLSPIPEAVESTRKSPASMTNGSTHGLFGTDVDDYLDVNEWSNVKPEKVFGFLSYGWMGTNEIKFGLAGQVADKFYLGGFLEGEGYSWTSEKDTKKKGKDKNTTTTRTSSTTGVSGSLLFGFNNIGVMGSLTYTPTDTTKNFTTSDTVNKTKNIYNKFNLEVGLKAGMNIKGPNDMLFKTSAELALTSNVDNWRIESTGSSKWHQMKNDNTHTLLLNGGVSFDFAHNGSVTQGASFGLNTAWKIYPTLTEENTKGKTATKVYGKLDDTIALDSAWQLTYEPEESKVVLKAKVGLPIAFHFNNNYDYEKKTDSSGEKKQYNISRIYTTDIGFKPTVSVGLTYAPVSKFRLNLGAKFNAPTFGWQITTTKTRDSNGKLTSDDSVDKKVVWQFNNNNSGKIEVGTGFTWLISQNITFDAYWNLGKDLLNNNFRVTLSGAGTDTIWTTLNKLVAHDIGFLLSVKL